MLVNMKKAAIAYREKLGWCIIPVRKDKKPYIQWQQYVHILPTLKEIEAWWTKWPDANLGLVTGKISNITVIDIDEKKGEEKIQDYIPENLEMPISMTGGKNQGRHLFFQ